MVTRDLAEDLRNAAGWLRLAADALDEGDTEKARKMAAIGKWGAAPLPDEIAALAEVPSCG